MQILTGQKGDRLDKALTLREAAELGMVNLRRNGSGQIVPEIPPGNSGDPEWSGVQQPVAPTGVTADGAFHTITLTWDAPAYKGHSYAEILRAEVDNPSSAVAIGTTLANVYSDAVGKGFSAFYWVRFVNKNGMTGPLHGTSGLHAATSPDVDELIASATNFAIYNPAKPAEKEIIFGVTDGGKVAIREAVIKAATIQIIHSEKITADYIKAGVSISAPLISGGSFDMGNAYMKDGAGGFGLGGPYSAWAKGWYTLITADGYIYTNRLRAEGGYVKNMTMSNCTIEEDCVVKGTIYANKIVGDVFIERVKRIAQTSFASAPPPSVNWVTVGAAVISDGDSRDRNVVFEGLIVSGTIGGNSSGTLQVRLLFNGAKVDYQSSSGTNTSTISGMALAVRSTYFHTLPANTVGTYQLQVGGNLSSQYYEANVLSMRIGRQGASLS
ncbi:hypothetical protein [Aeromonas sp. 3P]|uniref:hypothetical protein n=1 Tax=Aeromonas sp. 3P TaxID=3452719 RepID=UPI003F79299B